MRLPEIENSKLTLLLPGAVAAVIAYWTKPWILQSTGLEVIVPVSAVVAAIAWKYLAQRGSVPELSSHSWLTAGGLIGLLGGLVALFHFNMGRTPEGAGSLFFSTCVSGILLGIGLKLHVHKKNQVVSADL